MQVFAGADSRNSLPDAAKIDILSVTEKPEAHIFI